MIISLIENIDEDFAKLLNSLESLKTQLYQTDWNNLYIQIAESRIDEVKSIIFEQQKIIEELAEELITNDTNSSNESYGDEENDIELDDIIDEENDDYMDDDE